MARAHRLCVLSSSSPHPLGFQVPQVEQKETMREVNGEMGEREWKKPDLGSNSRPATCHMAIRRLAPALVKWGMTWDDYKEGN